MDSYTSRYNKFDPKFRKNFGTSHPILDIHFRIVSILNTPANVHPRTSYEGPGQKYSFTLSLISTLDGCGCSTPRPGRFTPGKRPNSHCTGGWVGPREGPDGVHKEVRPHRDAIPGPSSLKRAAIQTTLCLPTDSPVNNEIQGRWRVRKLARTARLVPTALICLKFVGHAS
jgi:hypothetical protein